jgi:hypothetical protein
MSSCVQGLLLGPLWACHAGIGLDQPFGPRLLLDCALISFGSHPWLCLVLLVADTQALAPLRACFLRVLAGRSSLARSPMPHVAELALRAHLLLLQLPCALRSIATRAPAPASMAGRELQPGRLRCSPALAAVPLSLVACVDVPSARSCPSSQLLARAKLSVRRRFSPARAQFQLDAQPACRVRRPPRCQAALSARFRPLARVPACCGRSCPARPLLLFPELAPPRAPLVFPARSRELHSACSRSVVSHSVCSTLPCRRTPKPSTSSSVPCPWLRACA